MRALLIAIGLAWVVVSGAATPAEACVRAAEANRLLGWSADGAYALLGRFDRDGALEHAEIVPTAYRGSVYVVAPQDDAVVVTKVKVGTCADFGDDDGAVIERRRGKLTEAMLRDLKTVAAMKFSTDAGPAPTALPSALPTARFTGAKRYAVHDLAITDGATTTTLPLPVWCVGSCLRDEAWTKWKAEVVAVHAVAGGPVLYELRLTGVCNGGTLIRVVAATPAKAKPPKRRCFGSGQ